MGLRVAFSAPQRKIIKSWLVCGPAARHEYGRRPRHGGEEFLLLFIYLFHFEVSCDPFPIQYPQCPSAESEKARTMQQLPSASLDDTVH